MKRITLFLCLLLLLTSVAGCSKTNVFSSVGGANLTAEDLDAYLLQESDRLLTLMQARFTEEFLRVYSSSEELIACAQELLGMVGSTAQAQKAYVITFDSYTNPLEYQYQHEGSPDMATTNGLPSMILSNVVAAQGATQLAASNILRYFEFTACPAALAGKRAVVVLDYMTAAAVFSFTSETYGLSCTAQFCPIAVDSGMTVAALANQLKAGGTSSLVEYNVADLTAALERSVQPQMVPLNPDDRSLDTFLTETATEMADYMTICRSSAYVSLFYGSMYISDLMPPVASAIPGPVQQTDTFIGLDTDVFLAEHYPDAGAAQRTDLSSLVSYQIVGQYVLGNTCGSDPLVLANSLMIQRYYEKPPDFKPAAVLLRYSDKVGILVSYAENHGVVTANAMYISLTEGTLDQFAEALGKYAEN